MRGPDPSLRELPYISALSGSTRNGCLRPVACALGSESGASNVQINATYICYTVVVKRTTIFLPDELHERLREEAFRLRISMAELIRTKLQPAAQPGEAETDPLLEVAGICNDGGLTADIDKEIYGI